MYSRLSSEFLTALTGIYPTFEGSREVKKVEKSPQKKRENFPQFLPNRLCRAPLFFLFTFSFYFVFLGGNSASETGFSDFFRPSKRAFRPPVLVHDDMIISIPFKGIPFRIYRLPRKESEAHYCFSSHPLLHKSPSERISMCSAVRSFTLFVILPESTWKSSVFSHP